MGQVAKGIVFDSGLDFLVYANVRDVNFVQGHRQSNFLSLTQGMVAEMRECMFTGCFEGSAWTFMVVVGDRSSKSVHRRTSCTSTARGILALDVSKDNVRKAFHFRER